MKLFPFVEPLSPNETRFLESKKVILIIFYLQFVIQNQMTLILQHN